MCSVPPRYCRASRASPSKIGFTAAEDAARSAQPGGPRPPAPVPVLPDSPISPVAGRHAALEQALRALCALCAVRAPSDGTDRRIGRPFIHLAKSATLLLVDIFLTAFFMPFGKSSSPHRRLSTPQPACPARALPRGPRAFCAGSHSFISTFQSRARLGRVTSRAQPHTARHPTHRRN